MVRINLRLASNPDTTKNSVYSEYVSEVSFVLYDTGAGRATKSEDLIPNHDSRVEY